MPAFEVYLQNVDFSGDKILRFREAFLRRIDQIITELTESATEVTTSSILDDENHGHLGRLNMEYFQPLLIVLVNLKRLDLIGSSRSLHY